MSDQQVIAFLLEKVNARRKSPLTVESIKESILHPKEKKPVVESKSGSEKKPSKPRVTKTALLEFALEKLGTTEQILKDELMNDA